MTVFGRDASNFDGAISYAGLGYFTHKSTEGTSISHDQYGSRLNAARAAGVPVLGSYHVVRTPGNGGAGSLAQQLSYWLAYMDAHTPWWRTWPHWMMQIDAEKWPYDAVSAATVKAFAALLVASGAPGYKVTYASRGEYGDSLAGIATDLWNADYRGSINGSYPGDNWASGWAPYSGKPPRFLQYASRPWDEDAYRGTLAELLALTGPGEAAPSTTEVPTMFLCTLGTTVYMCSGGVYWPAPDGPTAARWRSMHPPEIRVANETELRQTAGRPLAEAGGTLTDAQVAAEADRIAAALIASPRNALTDADHAAIKTDLVAVLNAKLQAAAGA